MCIRDRLSMNKQDCSISEVLKEIEKNSEYTFFLNDNQVNVNRKTSVKANNASLEEVLEQALKNTGYQYEIVDRQIIIKSKSVSSVSHPNALFQSSPRKITGQVKDCLLYTSVLRHRNGGVARVSETDGYRVILPLKIKIGLPGDLVPVSYTHLQKYMIISE